MLSTRTRLSIGVAAGLLAALALAAHTGIPAITEALAELRWVGLGVVCALQVGAIALCGAAWWLLTQRSRVFACIAARWVRDGASSTLAILPGIGELSGARALKLFGAKSSDAAASTVVDIVTESLSQLVFTLCGIVPLLDAAGGDEMVQGLGALAAATPPALAIVLVSRSPKALALLERLVTRIGHALGLAAEAAHLDLATNVALLYRRRARIVSATLIHLAAWFLGAVQVWAAARALGRPISFGAALALDSLGYAARGAFFIVPMGAGVQEMSFVLVGTVLGIDGATAIALSLVLRARDVVLGVPAVLVWLAAEARQVWLRSGRELPG
jgi:putative membrane protein